MLVPGPLAGLYYHDFEHIASCSRGLGVFNRQRYGHKSLLSDKRKIKTSCRGKTVGSVKSFLLHTHPGLLSHTHTSDLEQVPYFLLSVSRVCGCLPVQVWLRIRLQACTFTFVDAGEMCVRPRSFRILCVSSPPDQH